MRGMTRASFNAPPPSRPRRSASLAQVLFIRVLFLALGIAVTRFMFMTEDGRAAMVSLQVALIHELRGSEAVAEGKDDTAVHFNRLHQALSTEEETGHRVARRGVTTTEQHARARDLPPVRRMPQSRVPVLRLGAD